MWIKIYFLIAFVLGFLPARHYGYLQKACEQVINNRKCQVTPDFSCMCDISVCTGNVTDLSIQRCNEIPGNELLSILQTELDIDALEIHSAMITTIPAFVCDNMTNLAYLKITNNSIPSIPEECFKNSPRLESVELQHNVIEKLPQLHTNNEIKFLDLSNNAIDSISRDAWISIIKGSVKTLMLNGNRINESVLFELRDITLSSQVKIHLYDNPFSCDCNNLWIKDWLIKNKDMFVNIEDIKCSHPTKPAQSIIKVSIGVNYFVCDNPEIQRGADNVINLAVALIVVLVSLPLLALVACLIAYKHRIALYDRTTWHPFDREECEGESMLYDVYISCSHDSEEWVKNFLMLYLKAQKFKVTYHREHLETGHSIYDNIGECIENSKRTLCVLSKKYTDNDICMFELNYTLNLDMKHKRRRTMLLISEDFDIIELDGIVQTSIKRYKFIDKRLNHFKQNLLYSLPIQKLGQDELKNITKSSDKYSSAVDVPQNVPMYDYF